MIKRLDYSLLIRLLRVFNSTTNIYDMSKNIFLFNRTLKNNKLFISKDTYSCFINSKLKLEASKIYENITKQKIEIIPIHSKIYPKKLMNIYNPPIVIFAYGNTKMLNTKSIHVYNNDRFSYYGKKIYDLLINSLIKKDANLVYKKDDIKIGKCISIEEVDIICDDFTLDKNKTINNKELYLFLQREKNSLEEIICGISDILIIPQAEYAKDICMMSDIMLELGKEISVVPGNVLDKKSSFSNKLLKDGAGVLLSDYDLDYL